MRVAISCVGIAVLGWGVLVGPAHAQKGMGQQSGVARKTVKPKVVTLSGKVLEVKTEPCKMTTGRAYLGTHFILETSEAGPLNIHLGPAVVVDFAAKELKPGTQVTVKAFRTAQMPKDHYTAQSFDSQNTTFSLRDENLRPLWAGGGTLLPRHGAPQQPAQTARSPGQGRGAGYGRGWGLGRGSGWGRGAGPRRGPGWAFVDQNYNGICDNYERLWGPR